MTARVRAGVRNRIVLAVLLAFESAALAVGWRVADSRPIDWSRLGSWLERTEPEVAVLGLGRLLVVGLAAWLLVSTLAAILGRLVLSVERGRPGLHRIAAWSGRLAPTPVRHLVEAAIAVGLVTSASASPAFAARTPMPREPVVAAVARPVVAPLSAVRDGRTPIAAPSASPTPPASPARPASSDPGLPSASSASSPAPGPPPSAPAPGSAADLAPRLHLVRPGENLWSVARAHLDALGLPHDTEAVDLYWRMLCDANRDRLRSGDVHVVQPGEEIDLPPVA